MFQALSAIGSYALPQLASFGLDLAQTAARQLLGDSQSPYVKTLGQTATQLIDTFGNAHGISQPSHQRQLQNRFRSSSVGAIKRRRPQRPVQDDMWQDEPPQQQRIMRNNDYEQSFD